MSPKDILLQTFFIACKGRKNIRILCLLMEDCVILLTLQKPIDLGWEVAED